jgi:hypothetical protein
MKCGCCGAGKAESNSLIARAGAACPHLFACHCCQKLVCQTCDKCETHCHCEVPQLAPPYSYILDAAKAGVAA